jgi:hypothetical protein
MVFAVMLPMVIGSNISTAVFATSKINEFGQTEKAPDQNMFLVTAIAAIIAIAPLIWLYIQKKKGTQPLNKLEEPINKE